MTRSSAIRQSRRVGMRPSTKCRARSVTYAHFCRDRPHRFSVCSFPLDSRSSTRAGVGRRAGNSFAEPAEQHRRDGRRDLLREDRLAQHHEVIAPRGERAGADRVDQSGQDAGRRGAGVAGRASNRVCDRGGSNHIHRSFSMVAAVSKRAHASESLQIHRSEGFAPARSPFTIFPVRHATDDGAGFRGLQDRWYTCASAKRVKRQEFA